MRYLVDTNVIVRAIHPGDPLRVFAQQSLRRLRSQNHRLCILPQNVAEFWAVCTRPAGPQGNGLGLDPAMARRLIARFEPLFDLYYETPGVYRQWKRLVAVREISGRQVHDTRLVAAAIVHNFERILTFDIVHFGRYEGIEIVDPRNV